MLQGGQNQRFLLLQMNKRLGFLAILLACSSMAMASDVWTLERSINYALSHNPDAQIAQQRIAVAQAGLDQANAAFWPRMQVQSGYMRTDNPMMVFGSILNQRAYSPSLNFNNVPDTDNFNARGIITVPLYAGGRNMAGREAAKANAAATKQDREAVRNALGFEVSRIFYTILKTRRFIEAAESEVNSFESSLEAAKNRLDGGTLLKSDVLDIEVRLAQAREDLVSAHNANTLSEYTLRNLLGIEGKGEFIVAANAPSISVPELGDSSQRPELAAAQDRELASKAQVRGAKSGYLPRLSAYGSLDYNYGWTFNHDGESYSAGYLAQWDLWDGNETRAKVREAKANLESSREEQRKLRLAINLETEQARLNLKAANERLLVTDKMIGQAIESLGLTQSRFKQGVALSTQLIDAQSALVATQVRRAEAEADQRIAVAALRKALALPQLNTQTISK